MVRWIFLKFTWCAGEAKRLPILTVEESSRAHTTRVRVICVARLPKSTCRAFITPAFQKSIGSGLASCARNASSQIVSSFSYIALLAPGCTLRLCYETDRTEFAPDLTRDILEFATSAFQALERSVNADILSGRTCLA